MTPKAPGRRDAGDLGFLEPLASDVANATEEPIPTDSPPAKSRLESQSRREPVKARRSGPFESRGESLWDKTSMARRAAMSVAEHGSSASAGTLRLSHPPPGARKDPRCRGRIDFRTRCAAKNATPYRSAGGADLKAEEGGSRPPSRCDGPSPRSALTPGLLKEAPIRPSKPWSHPR